MHAPNYDRGSERNSGGVPVFVSDYPRQLATESARGAIQPDSGYPETEAEGSGYRELFFKYLGLALKHRWLVLGVCGLSLVIGFLVTFTTTPIYRATAIIQINRDAAKVVKVDAPDAMAETSDAVRFYQTQYDLLKSRSLAERVAANLDLANASGFLNPEPTSAWGNLWGRIFPTPEAEKASLAQRKAGAVGRILGGVSIAPVPNSSLVRISFDSPSPEWAQKITDGVADNFVSANLERRYGATAYARNFIKERLEELKLKLEESEKSLVAYAAEKEILTADSKVALEDADLAALNTALQQVRTDRMRYEQLWEQANNTKTGSNLPQIANDGSIQALRAKRATLMIEYQDKLGLFKPAYPEMLKLKAQIDQIDQEIKSAANVIKGTLRAQYEAARSQEALLEKSIAQSKTDVLDLRSKGIQYRILQREVDTNRTLYDGLLQQYKDIGVAGAVGTNNISIIDYAERPGAPFKPNLNKNLAISFVLGLLAAALAIAVMEILDDTFKSPEELEEQLSLAVLGIIPKVDGKVLKDLKDSPNSPIAEAYRSFRTALQFSTDQGAPKSIVVTSARPSEGKSTTALGLAMNFAQLGMTVLLVDADLRKPSLHKALGCDNDAGLANYLAGAAAAQGVFRKTDVEGLSFMASGPLPPNPAELLAGPKMAALLSVASENFDAVIVDAPPVMGLADTPLLASVAAGTLLVVAAGEARRGIVKAAMKRLYFARARMVGAVLNKFNFRAASYGYGGYGYGYGYGYGEMEHYGYGAQAPSQIEHTPSR